MSDYKVFAGDDATITLEVIDEETNELMDWSALSAVTFVVSRAQGYAAVISKSLSSGIVTDGDGYLVISLSQADLNVTPRIYEYQCRITRSGKRDTVRFGQITIHHSL